LYRNNVLFKDKGSIKISGSNKHGFGLYLNCHRPPFALLQRRFFMVISRISYPAISAGLVTLGLLMLMAHLVTTQKPSLDEDAPKYTFNFWREAQPLEQPIPKERPIRPGPVETAPPLPPPGSDPIKTEGSKNGIILPPPPIGGPGNEQSTSSPGLTPLVKISPQYPIKAATKGIQGYVIVEYTVSKLGQVINPRVIDANPRGYFENAALRAIKKFRYNPHQIDGVAMDMHGVLQRFTFELDK
jgi:protein TonB